MAARTLQPGTRLPPVAPAPARVVSVAPLAYVQDFTLAQRAAEGDARAEKQVAQRLIVRVRRAAHALMGGALEADDAAQHALIELLRSVRDYPGELSLERWADRLAARSLVRFARAVRARRAVGGAADGTINDAARPELFARTFEEFLRELPSAPREALLLREGFGFDLVEIARLLRVSTRAIREHLSRTRLSLYLRTVKEADAWGEPLPEPIERWFALRDRAEASPALFGSRAEPRASTFGSRAEPRASTTGSRAEPRASTGAAGTASAAPEELSPAEQEELRTLETQPELRKLQKELRALSQFVEGGRFGRLGQREKRLVEGALAAARVSAISASQALPSEAAREVPSEAIDTSWVHPISMAMCVALVVFAFVALALRTPQPVVQRPLSGAARVEAPRAPTVEALSSAHAVERGARLSRAGEPLERGMSLREGDVVSAQTRAGCFGLSPRADVCLAASSEARIAQLGLSARRVELLRGRAVASVERVEPGVPFALSVRTLRVETTDAVLGFELDGDELVVRVLRGAAVITTPHESRPLTAAQSAIYRAASGQLEVVPQLAEKARRDWDLLATRAFGEPTDRPAQGPKPEAPSAPAASSEPALAPALDPANGSPPSAAHEEEVALVEAEPQAAETQPKAAETQAAPVEPAALEEAPSGLEPAAEPNADPAATPEEQLTKAKTLSRERRFVQAAELYLELIRTAPSTRSAREALVLRGELLSERLTRPAEALPLFDRYLSTGGGLLEVRARYGRILAFRHLNRAAEERAASQEFLFSHGDTPQARALRARVEARGSAREQDTAQVDAP
jgi:RNA polymerase sigma-70 factor, ECF subfamily